MNASTNIPRVLLVAMLVLGPRAFAHDGHFSAGVPGNPKKPFRTVEVTVKETDDSMHFVPDRVEVKRGEQVKFVIRNTGSVKHEFMLATTKDNLKHQELMKKFPDMEHDDPNGKTLAVKAQAEVLWLFNKRGEFEFACLIPGHREAGMHGKVVVK
jgi:uncharacterized cupredoxin-like copper-binding protein